MDAAETMKTAGISASLLSIVGSIWIVVKKFNNKRCHSNCCGRDMEVVVAVNDITEEEKRATPRSSPVIRPISDPMNIEKIDLEK